MARSVRPGGRVLCLEIARPRSRLARFMRWWFDRIVPAHRPGRRPGRRLRLPRPQRPGLPVAGADRGDHARGRPRRRPLARPHRRDRDAPRGDRSEALTAAGTLGRVPSPFARAVETVAPARLGRSFRWLLAASIVTNVGDGVALAAGPLLVASLTQRSVPRLAGACSAQYLPVLLFGVIGGRRRRPVRPAADGRRRQPRSARSSSAVLAVDDRQRVRQHRRSSSSRCSSWAPPRRSPTRRAAPSCPASSRARTSASPTPGCRARSCSPTSWSPPPIGAFLFAVGHGARRSPRTRPASRWARSSCTRVVARAAGAGARRALGDPAPRWPRASAGCSATRRCARSRSRSSRSTSRSARPGRCSSCTRSDGWA